MKKSVKATIRFDALPGNAVIAGKVIGIEESSWQQVEPDKKVVLSTFHCKTVRAVQQSLKNKKVHRIEIKEIIWKK